MSLALRTLLVPVLALTLNLPAVALDYPATRQDQTVDDYFGTSVADPYRWLEDDNSPETQAWVTAQNKLTESYVRTPQREAVLKRLTELWNYPRVGVPARYGEAYFVWKNDGLQNQSVLVRQSQPQSEGQVVLDPNTLSADGTVAIGTTATREDGTALAYGVSDAGSDTQTLHFRDLTRLKDLPDTVPGLRNSSVGWSPDGKGVYYNRYPTAAEQPGAAPNTHNRVYYHALGTPASADRLVYSRPNNPKLDFYPFVSEDGAYLLIQSYNGTAPENGVVVMPLNGKAQPQELIAPGRASFSYLGHVGSRFYFQTSDGAPKGKIIAIDVNRPEPEHWQTILPEQTAVLDQAMVAGGQLVTVWMQDASHRLRVYDLQGQRVREQTLPTLGSVSGLQGKQHDPELFYSFSAWTHPSEVWKLDLSTGQSQLVRRSPLRFNPDDYHTEQVFVPSRDGTQIPVFLISKKGVKPDKSHPALLYGYGGFNISLTPHLALAQIPWLDAGGVYAVANLRGGGEYGEAWHQAGMLTRKQNVFDDFIAVGEWLIASGWSHPRKLAIQGGSNGGLLTAACMVQRPELFGAVISQVPVLDMLRYHRFSVGRFWIPEYGSAEASAEAFQTLYRYSPLHNVKKVAYPPLLVMSADHDDRVLPAHASKFIATVQAQAQGDQPHLLRVEFRAGHGAGKPISKTLAELADMYGFLFRALELR
ncbi:MAG: prolyl oligopeptidase family serine peptidase [Candidatus Sericytochromatia bacterium]